jgi:hypothetical protein
LLKLKSEVIQKFYESQALVEHFFDRKILSVQSDWGGEYERLNSFTKIGISHQVSCPHTHQQNGSAERKYRHIVEVGLSLLARAHMPLKFWDEAFQATTYLINRVPSKTIQYQAPLQRLYQVKPNYSSLHIFGCACWSNLRPYNQRKLKFRSKECVFLGYNNINKGFKCLDVSTDRIYISRDVVFDESIFPFAKLHPNAGVRLRSKILLLPPSLIPPESLHNGVNNLGEPATNFPHPVNTNCSSSTRVQVADFSRPDCIGSPANVNPTDSRPDCINSPTNADPTDSRPDCIGSPASSAPMTSTLPIAGTGRGHMAPASSSSQQPAVQRPRTRLSEGIRQPRVYTDGTIRYGMLTTTGEPSSLTEALSDANWKKAMYHEFDALVKNKIWHLVPS